MNDPQPFVPTVRSEFWKSTCDLRWHIVVKATKGKSKSRLQQKWVNDRNDRHEWRDLPEFFTYAQPDKA